MTYKCEAIYLAEWLESEMKHNGGDRIAKELRRQHARIAELEAENRDYKDLPDADAAKALSELIQWNIDVATNPQTNGGLSLQPVAEVRAEPTQDHIPPSDEDAFEHYVSDCDGSGIQYDGPSYERGFRTGKTVGIDSVTTEVQAEPVAGDYPHDQMDALALARYKVVPSDQSMYWRHAVVAGDGRQHLYNGSEVDCQNMARKFAGAFLDGAFAFHERYTAPQAQPADALVAERIDDLYIALEVCAAELFAQCGDQGRAMKYVEQARKTLAAEQCIRAALAATPEVGATDVDPWSIMDKLRIQHRREIHEVWMPLVEELRKAAYSAKAEVQAERDFYKRRHDELQGVQSKMRDPERTMVCDILANGHLLQDGSGNLDASRYGRLAQRQVPQQALSLLRWSEFLLATCSPITDKQLAAWPHLEKATDEMREHQRAMLAASPTPPQREGLTDELFPMQPVVVDPNGFHRFSKNRIVRRLVDHGRNTGYGLNEIAFDFMRGDYTADEQMQVAQLIGYSVHGYGTLSYVTDESYERAAAMSAAIEAAHGIKGATHD